MMMMMRTIVMLVLLRMRMRCTMGGVGGADTNDDAAA